jgi:hypothetical protein
MEEWTEGADHHPGAMGGPCGGRGAQEGQRGRGWTRREDMCAEPRAPGDFNPAQPTLGYFEREIKADYAGGGERERERARESEGLSGGRGTEATALAQVPGHGEAQSPSQTLWRSRPRPACEAIFSSLGTWGALGPPASPPLDRGSPAPCPILCHFVLFSSQPP